MDWCVSFLFFLCLLYCTHTQVTFKDIIIASHQNAIFRTILPDENETRIRRRRAQQYLLLLKEGVWGLINRSRVDTTDAKDGSAEEVIAMKALATTQRHNGKLVVFGKLDLFLIFLKSSTAPLTISVMFLLLSLVISASFFCGPQSCL